MLIKLGDSYFSTKHVRAIEKKGADECVLLLGDSGDCVKTCNVSAGYAAKKINEELGKYAPQWGDD